MLQVDKIDTGDKKQVNEFVMFPFRLYQNCPQWVPPIISDIKVMLNSDKHPFYEHSFADFFVARRNGEIVGRIAAMENIPFNKTHDVKKAQFYLFESIDDTEVSSALFERAFEWSRARGLNEVVGPKGFSLFDGYGIQIEGSEHRQMMNMMNYNLAYYPGLVEDMGFETEVDFVSSYIKPEEFKLPEKVHEIARRVKERGSLKVKLFKSKRELMKWAIQIGRAYNNTFVNNWEYYPITDRETQFLVDNVIAFADHRLIKIITHNDNVVGFLLGFPDVSAALQRAKGRITPWSIADMMLEMRRTKWISLNGVGVLPEFHGRGGNALLYTEMQNTLGDFGFEHAEQTQMADTAVQVRRDMENLGAKIYKVHRVYHRAI
jgi:hypothetical protein